MRALVFALMLAGCGGGSSDPAMPSDPPMQPAPPAPPTQAIIDMHFGALHDRGWITADLGGLQVYAVTAPAPAGSLTITMSNVPAAGQLFIVHGVDGDYYTALADSVTYPVVTMHDPLPVAVSIGATAWNAYNNESHVNEVGFYAVVDYALRTMPTFPKFTTGKHVLLGDSWFVVAPGFLARLTARLPGATIIDKGVGGQTSAQVLARFTTDVTPNAPDFVWIMAGTNDYFAGVPAVTYAANITQMIAMTKAIGAVPIVFTSSVGSHDLSPTRFDLSNQYAAAVH